MSEMAAVLIDRVTSGLRRKSIQSCSRWAEEYRVMGKPFPGRWTFDWHPWLREMHDCEDPEIVGQKAAQMGYTETLLNKTFFNIDIKGNSVLYVLPASKPDAADFSSARFDPALEMSTHLKTLFSETKNVQHKRAGSANLFVRGSRSRSQLKSVPASFAAIDEFDEMDQSNVALIPERASGQLEKQMMYISTATIPKYGINKKFEASNQQHFFFKSPFLGGDKTFIELTEDCLVITSDDAESPDLKKSYIKCPVTKKEIPHDQKRFHLKDGIWQPTKGNCNITGFYVNQLYSSTVQPWELAQSKLRGLSNPADEQEYYNSKMGLCHIVEGARVTDENLDASYGEYRTVFEPKRKYQNHFITMGIDVGKWLHFVIKQWFIDDSIKTNDISLKTTSRIIRADKVKDFSELGNLMLDYSVNYAVIDANPERRKAFEFAQEWAGYVKLCFYAKGVTARQINIHSEEGKEHCISVDRTSWLDVTLARYRSGKIKLPFDISTEFKDHIKALVRIYEKDADGNPIGRYVNGDNDDHFAHADNYAEIALPMAVSLQNNRNIHA